MAVFSLFPLSLTFPARTHLSFPKTHFPNPIPSPNLPLFALQPPSTTRTKSKTTVVVSGINSSSEPPESAFLDENGAVDDMDGYLNYLSLEYDSVWDTKPSWCQPWTITLTGVLIIASSWLILHSITISAIVLSLICAWWYIFLYSYPKAYSDMIADRKNRVSNGLEDTFGSSKER